MSDLVGSSDWADFHKLFQVDAVDTFAQMPITWRRLKTNLDRFKEDNLQGLTEDIPLTCLVNYNWLRSWPITNHKESGEINGESFQVMFGKKYLSDLGYLDNNGMFIYNQDYDRFILEGKILKPDGDTPVSQAQNLSLWYSVILIEQPTKTAEKRT